MRRVDWKSIVLCQTVTQMCSNNDKNMIDKDVCLLFDSSAVINVNRWIIDIIQLLNGIRDTAAGQLVRYVRKYWAFPL